MIRDDAAVVERYFASVIWCGVDWALYDLRVNLLRSTITKRASSIGENTINATCYAIALAFPML